MATSSTAYARNSKPLTERKQPRIVKNLSKIEPKKLGVGLVAGCCLAFLTYISLATVFDVSILSTSPSISNSSSSSNFSEQKDGGAISNETFMSKETEEDPVLDIPVPKETNKVQETAPEVTQRTTLKDSNSKTGIDV